MNKNIQQILDNLKSIGDKHISQEPDKSVFRQTLAILSDEISKELAPNGNESKNPEPFGWFVDVEYCGFTRTKPTKYLDCATALYAEPVGANKVEVTFSATIEDSYKGCSPWMYGNALPPLKGGDQ